MKTVERVLVTGGSGLVGHCLLEEVSREAPLNGSTEFVFLSSRQADLSDLQAARRVFEQYIPDYVIHLAAHVGGLYANLADSTGLFYKLNSQINENVLKLSYDFKVKRCLSCLSTCIFPNEIEYPLDETKIHSGPPHPSNVGYALAKRQLDLLNKEYNARAKCINGQRALFFSIIPVNIYGPHDNFATDRAHVVPDLIRRAHELLYLSNQNGLEESSDQRTTLELIVLGSGAPLRQFIYAPDLAKLILWSLNGFNDFTEPSIIMCPSERDELSIGQLARHICSLFEEKLRLDGHKRVGRLAIRFDSTRSDGQYKKTASNAKLLNSLPDFQFTPIEVGLRATIDWYCANYPRVRPSSRGSPFCEHKDVIRFFA